ncbi:MAG: P-II family nitrogen regulator [Syntrophothermus sp.]
MEHLGLTKMIKVEVVVAGGDAAAVRDQIEAAGARGFTSLSRVSGLGHHGYHEGGILFNEQDSLTLIITVVPEDAAEGLVTGLRVLLERSAGVMFVSDTYVSRPEYFR